MTQLSGFTKNLKGVFADAVRNPRILDFVKKTTARGAERFITKDKFLEGETDGVLIARISDNFTLNLLDKIEVNVEDAKLNIHRLREQSYDMPIIHELGGEKIVETSLSHFWSLLKRQGHGGDGDLLTNGYANIVYVRDSQGILWAVRAYWHSNDPRIRRGWRIEAYPVELVKDPFGWDIDLQVISLAQAA
ncbi:MAG: hypothetical protein WDZ70_01115 [Candidatus Paceibacterota bacterium]